MKKSSFCIRYNSGCSCTIPGYVLRVGDLRVGVSNYRHPEVKKRTWEAWELTSGKPIKIGFDTMLSAQLFLSRNYSRVKEACEYYLAVINSGNANPGVDPKYQLLSAKWG